MISFDLCCGKGHSFEGWFSSSADYDLQQSAGLVACPMCNDSVVQKLLSVPNIGRKGNQPARQVETIAAEPKAVLDAPVSGPVVNMAALPQAMVEIVQKMAEKQAEVLKSSQWVGRQFAEAARAIHYGESDDRMIHGEASPQEAEALADEGVSVAQLPFPFIPPEAKN